MMQLRLSSLGVLLSASLVLSAQAADKTVNMTLNIIVNGPPPCTITGGTVEFGTMLLSKVDGSNYKQPVSYSLDCSARVSDYLKLQIQGTALTVNGESVLATDTANLGIRLQQASDASLVPVGDSEWLRFQYTGSSGPVLEAVPVKVSGSTLTAGEFNAAATMVVEYQ